MNNRGEIIWAPFNSVINSNEVLNELAQEQLEVKKPLLTEDKIAEIEKYIINSFHNNTLVHIKYYDNHKTLTIDGFITKIDPLNKKISLDNKTNLFFYNIIDIYS